MSKKKTHEEFVKELKNINPNIEVIGKYIGSRENIKVKCLKCTGKWEPMASSLLTDRGCPYCCSSPKKILIGFNDIWTTNPELAKLLANPEDGYKYTQYSHKKVDLKCLDCGNIIKNKSINDISIGTLSCPNCGDGISYPEKIAFNLLKQLMLEFTYQYSPDWIKPKRYDFYFKIKYNEYILEIDGKLGHGNNNPLNGQVAKESKEIDDYKEKLAKEHNIEVIRIDCFKSDLEYIKKNILNSKLATIFNLSNIDWLKCHQYACSSLVKTVCDLWNNQFKSTKKIANKIKLHRDTVRKYLKQGAELGWCSYNSKEESMKNLKKVLCIETNIVYDSISEAIRNIINGSNSRISQCCKGKRDTCGILEDGTKLHWEFV